MKILCPHCQCESEIKTKQNLNTEQDKDAFARVQDLSYFRVKCENCGESMLTLQNVLYHDVANAFMVWLWTEEEMPPKAQFDPLAQYTLRVTSDFNAFREKLRVLTIGLDDRAVEMMKMLLFMQLKHDLDVVEIVFHEIDGQTGDFRFAAVLSDGVEQYAAMPNALYQKLRQDIDERLFTSSQDFLAIDMQWAGEALALMKEAEE